MDHTTSQLNKAARSFVPANPDDSTDLESWNPAAKVYVVDDDESIRVLIQALMERNGIGVATFASAEAFLSSYHPDYPGCLLLDVHMPGMSGFELQELLAQRGVAIPIIFFTAAGSVPKAVKALQRGAVDFIEKPFDYRELCERLRCSLRLDAQLRQRKTERISAASRVALLTDREREVVDRIVAGKPNKVIADELGICVKTVEFHRARIMEKLGVHSVAELVHLALNANGAGGHRFHSYANP